MNNGMLGYPIGSARRLRAREPRAFSGYVLVQQILAAGVSAGALPGTAWYARSWGAITMDESGLASLLSSTRLRLPAGRWRANCYTPAMRSGRIHGRLWDVMGGYALANGLTGYSHPSAGWYGSGESIITAEFALYRDGELEIQQKVEATSDPAWGQGISSAHGASVFCEAEFWRIGG